MYDITQLTYFTAPIAFALTYLLHSTAWILLMLCLVKLPPLNTPLLKNYLWKGALIGGLLTSMLIHFSGNSLLEIHLANEKNIAVEAKQQRINEVSIAKETTETFIPANDLNQTVREQLVIVDLPEENSIEEAVTIQPTITTPKAQEVEAANFKVMPLIISLGILFWLLGTLFFLLKETVRHFIFIKKIGKRKTINHPTVIYALNRIRLKLKQKLQIILSHSAILESPILIQNQEICLPEKAVDKLDASQMEAMLAHEIAHVIRKDYYWNCFLVLLDSVFFFQPLHRIAIKEIQTTNELLCDAWAAKTIGNNLALAQCLLTVATWMKSPTKTYPLVAGMSLKKSELSDRITSLINLPDMKKQRFNFLKVGLPFMLLLAFALLILPGFTFTSLTDAVPKKTVVTIEIEPIADSINEPINEPQVQPINEPTSIAENEPIKGQKAEASEFNITDLEQLESKVNVISKEQFLQPNLLINQEIEKLTPSENELVEKPIIAEGISTDKSPKKEALVTPIIRLEEKFATNKNHEYFDLFQKVERKAIEEADWKLDIKAIYYANLSCAGTTRSKLGGPLVTNKGDKNSLIFTLDYGNRVEYDTLQNCVHPPEDNDGYEYEVKGRLANWFGKQIYKATNTNIKGSHPAVVKSQWVVQSDNQKQTPMGVELLGKAAVKIEIYTTKGKHIKTVADGVFEAGKHEFVFPHVNIKRGTYRLVSTVDGETLSQNIRVKRTRFLNRREKNSCAALLRAVKGNKIAQVAALAKTTDPNCTYREEGEPRSPLNAAARKGNVEIGQLLLAANADVEFRARGDEGALMGAARHGHLDFVKLMIENGAKVNKTVDGDGTALINAVRGGHYEIVEYLLENGADPMLGVAGDENPITHAVDQGDKMLDLLLKYRKKTR